MENTTRSNAAILRTIGIDPGVTGAIAMLEPKLSGRYLTLKVSDIPTSMRYNSRTKLDGQRLIRLLDNLAQDDGAHTIIGVEAVHAMPVSGSIGVFSQGHIAGGIEAVLDILLDKKPWIEIVYVAPQRWKKHFALFKASKEDARAKAAAIYNQPQSLQRKKDHNRAEAALIALYIKDQALGIDAELRNA